MRRRVVAADVRGAWSYSIATLGGWFTEWLDENGAVDYLGKHHRITGPEARAEIAAARAEAEAVLR